MVRRRHCLVVGLRRRIQSHGAGPLLFGCHHRGRQSRLGFGGRSGRGRRLERHSGRMRRRIARFRACRAGRAVHDSRSARSDARSSGLRDRRPQRRRLPGSLRDRPGARSPAGRGAAVPAPSRPAGGLRDRPRPFRSGLVALLRFLTAMEAGRRCRGPCPSTLSPPVSRVPEPVSANASRWLPSPAMLPAATLPVAWAENKLDAATPPRN